MWEVDIDPEERKLAHEARGSIDKNGGADQAADFDDIESDFYDDFVIVER